MTALFLLVGFLGAGKTNLLCRLVPELVGRGLSPHVILNDYANARVDAALFEGMRAIVRPVSGGCVCCGSREQLLGELENYRPVEGGLVLVECNGTTDSEELIALLASEPRLKSFTLPAQVSVVDAVRWQKRFWHNALERDQLRTSWLWTLGHLEEAGPERAEAVRAGVQRLCGLGSSPADFEEIAGCIEAVVRGGTSRDSLSEGASGGQAAPGGGHEHAHDASRHHFSAMEFSLPVPVCRKELGRWLSGLPENVVRAKGLARLAGEPGAVYLFQKVHGSSEARFARLPEGDGHPEPVAILVGHDLTDDLLPGFGACLPSSPPN